jgi:hypothetical protein
MQDQASNFTEKKDIDPLFSPDEKLWRRISKKDINKASNSPKPNSLRLKTQISVIREKYGKYENVASSDKWNGIAEITAQEVSLCNLNNIELRLIHEHIDNNYGHTLIAFTLLPGKDCTQEEIETVRANLAVKMKIVREPT